jgi:DNA repair protein SbcC/Rad50
VKLLNLSASGYRTFDELEVAIPSGVVAITGQVGSGKSAFVEGIEVALYGRCRTGSLADQVGLRFDRLQLTLGFEHGGEVYRARRGYLARSRKPTFDLERSTNAGMLDPDAYGFEPLTRHKIAETQKDLVELIGLSWESFRASCFIAQKDAGAFTNADPADAKAILAEVIRLDAWVRLHALEHERAKAAQAEHAALIGRIEYLEEQSGDVEALERALRDSRDAMLIDEGLHRIAEKDLEAAADKVAALEQAAARYATALNGLELARSRLSERQAVVDRAAAANAEAVAVQQQIDDAGDPGAKIAELEAERAELDALRARRQEQELVRDRYMADAADARKTQGRLIEERDAVARDRDRLQREAAHLNEVGTEHRCPTCEQTLAGDAHATALLRIREQRDDAERRVAGYTQRIGEAQALAESRVKAAEAVELPPAPNEEALYEISHALANARQTEVALSGLRERLAGLQAQIAEVTPALEAEVAALTAEAAAAQEALNATEPVLPGALLEARALALSLQDDLRDAAQKLNESRAALVRAEAALEAAQKIAGELGNCRQKQAELLGEIDLAALMERGYGRGGVPAVLVDRYAIPFIEAEANRILAAFGEPNRVELRTQALSADGKKLKEGLWIVVQTPDGERGYKTFSGGEGTCIDLALRIGLARLLRQRGGSEIDFLIVDEPDGLDEAHQAALVEILLGLRDEFSFIALASHYPGLRDAPLDGIIELVSEDGRSRIVGAEGGEAVAA